MAGLCGSDLHPFFGRERGLDAGTVMGHEFVGDVIAVGADVATTRPGDYVCAPFTTSCGDCFDCRQGLTSRCGAGRLFGWREQGLGLDGGQAERVRVPLADGTLVKIPKGLSPETALLLGDNLSTGYFAAELTGIDPQGTYAVVGCGTVGLLAIQSAKRLGARQLFAIEPNDARRAAARRLGAIPLAESTEALGVIRDATGGRGADGVIELVGLPDAQRLAYELARPGGTLSIIGCHSAHAFSFSPAEAYGKNLTIRTGRCPARHYMSKLMPQLTADPMDLSWCITHRFSVDQAQHAYETFAGRKEDCIKALITF
jgi:threonine dehydrogenase-like Zn-dependent dehydrogenase